MNKHIQWLLAELPTLVEQGILPSDIAEKLRIHYDARLAGDKRRWALVSFAILGAALIGGGIILILAHNWDELSRVTRTALALAPLAIGQALAAFVLSQRKTSKAWRESTAIFWCASIGASIALIAQVYNLNGAFADFVLTWSLLALPIVYLLDSGVAAGFYWIGILCWLHSANEPNVKFDVLWAFWPLLLPAIPHVWRLIRRDRYSREAVALANVLALVVSSGVQSSLGRGGNGTLAYAGWFSALLLAGFLFLEDTESRRWPVFWLGGIGSTIMAMVMTTESFWRDRPWREAASYTTQTLTWLWPIVAIVLWLICLRRRELLSAVMGVFPLLVAVTQLVRQFNSEILFVFPVLFDAYILAAGIAAVAAGIQRRVLGLVNLGTLLIAILIIVRFFDTDIDLATRGMLFIATGAGFLAVNWMLARRIRGAQ